jgi:hypothetical protein
MLAASATESELRAGSIKAIGPGRGTCPHMSLRIVVDMAF